MTADNDFPTTGRLIAIDFGTVRIGIAICDPLWILVSPLEIRNVSQPAADAAYFRELAKRERVDGIVVGLPIHCDGGESEKSREARAFAIWLQQETGLPTRLFDERFTTTAAEQRMAGEGRKKRRPRNVDAIAAQVLLESFLESARYHKVTPGQAISTPPTGDQSLD